MSSSFKVRLLLFALTLGLASVALRLNLSFRKEEVLEQDGKTIEKRLHSKEQYVRNLLNDQSFFKSLKNIDNNLEWGQKLIPALRDDRKIFLSAYQDGRLKFYGAIQVVLSSDTLIKEGSTFIATNNGWYEAIKKIDGNFSAVCILPIKANYANQNRYLQNTFSTDLIASNNLEIATKYDKEVYNIRNSDGKYLFSVKLKSSAINAFYSSLELGLWILAIITGLTFINSLCSWMNKYGFQKSAVLALFCLLLAFRLADLEYRWFESHFELEIFNPKYYATNYYFPSIGAFLLNVGAVTWFLSFVYRHRNEIRFSNKPLRKEFNYIIYFVLGLIIVGACYELNLLFYGLITNSKIVFDVTNILNLTWLSWLSILILCFSVLCLYLLIQSIIAIGDSLTLSLKERIYVFSSIFFLSFLSHLFFDEFNISFLLLSGIVYLFLWGYYKHKKHVGLGLFIIAVFLFAIIASSKLARFQFLKERESRKLLATKLESSVDPNAVLLFLNLEKEITKDKFVLNYFANPIVNTSTYSNRLLKLYFTGYLSRYEFKTFEYNAKDNVLKGETETPLNTFKNQVISGSVKVSDYFYRNNNTFGLQNYFAILPIVNSGRKLGTLVIQLSSKSFTESGSFPELLDDGRIIRDYNFNEYSYAYYNNGRLVNQQGKYVFDLINNNLKGKPNDFIFVIKADNKGYDYSHLIYQPNAIKVIIISKEVPGLLSQLAAVSFIFLILLTFASIAFACIWIWRNFDTYNISFRHFKWHYLIKTNRMLYKTRIQVSMVSAVVITLIISGIITFINISNQYREQQEEGILVKVNKIATTFNKQLLRKGILMNDNEAETTFNIFAELNGTDLNLFDLSGDLIHSTQPKIYENGITARKMNSLAYLYLNKLQKSEYINKETIGKLNFIAAYVPLKNNEGIPLAYIGLPYFSNEKDYQERIGIFLNALINVYALVFVAIGFFAVFVANKITDPLTIIEKSLSETKIGRKNEPINWKRNDEIGNLIKEYNNMIAALEESAQKLARSERESAWREMAKQVAHEIKNPLTPLKLGVQLLDKSWKEKDPKFDVKFEKFSKSFIEQIESLAHIASEFSNFAKMPDTILERTDIKKVVKKSIDLYTDSKNITITLTDQTTEAIEVNADKDQLLRCFNNLIKNAIEAMPIDRPGIINITLKCISGILHIAIEDNGSGIAHLLRDRIFVPNFTTKSSGTGLGLAFVKQAIENMDGAISFNTGVNKGTTFTITLPVAKG